jgi:phosphoenolpyruvate carboxykinase (ATP)
MNNNRLHASISLKDLRIEKRKDSLSIISQRLHDMTIASGQGIETSTGAFSCEYRRMDSTWIDLL